MRKNRVTFVCDQKEKTLLQSVADRLERTMSDTIRKLIREKSEELNLVDGGEEVEAEDQ